MVTKAKAANELAEAAEYFTDAWGWSEPDRGDVPEHDADYGRCPYQSRIEALHESVSGLRAALKGWKDSIRT